MGKVLDGLYHLQLSKPHLNDLHNLSLLIFSNCLNVIHVSQLDELSSWHYRLGHSSMTERVLHDLENFFKASSVSKFLCEICLLAKHTSYIFLNLRPMQLNLQNLYLLTFGALILFKHPMVRSIFSPSLTNIPAPHGFSC